MIATRFIVSGKVQGVWYRASTREQALRLDLCGYAKNLDDGRVEVLAAGPEDAIDQLERWLWRGPELATVENVMREEISAAPELFGFDVEP